MIAFDFEYYRPTTIDEAQNFFQSVQSTNKVPIYYGGGTEFISRARRNEIKADAVIDLKGISECNQLKNDQNQIVIGAGVTLTEIIESNVFPVLSDVSRLIATRTERNKITIGGNLSSHLFYREALLPFLLADSTLLIAGKDGIRKENVNEICQDGIQLKDGDFIIQINTDSKFAQFPYSNSKKTKHSKVNYPILSLASIQVDGFIRIALSGLCNFPFRTEKVEKELNDSSRSIETRIKNVLNMIPGPILDDMHAAANYRKFVLETTLTKMLGKMEGVS